MKHSATLLLEVNDSVPSTVDNYLNKKKRQLTVRAEGLGNNEQEAIDSAVRDMSKKLSTLDLQ